MTKSLRREAIPFWQDTYKSTSVLGYSMNYYLQTEKSIIFSYEFMMRLDNKRFIVCTERNILYC